MNPNDLPDTPSAPLRIPSYRRHRPSGQAVATFGGRDFYLGAFGSKASKAEYRRRLAEWLAARSPTYSAIAPSALTTDFAALPGKQAQRKAFRGRLGSTQSPEDFAVVIDELAQFLAPVAQSVARNQPFNLSWKAAGPWW